jgi:hypothetical protein
VRSGLTAGTSEAQRRVLATRARVVDGICGWDILCADPTAAESDDDPSYLQFLQGITPRSVWAVEPTAGLARRRAFIQVISARTRFTESAKTGR